MGKASSMLGGKGGAALGALATLQQSGLDAQKAGSFVSMFFNFAKSKIGGDVVARVLGKMPELAKLAG
jgi:hypothetical protein